MEKKTFYRKDLKDNLRVWSIQVDEPDLDYPQIVIYAGIFNGALIETVTPIEKGLGGKSLYDQAVADANTEINKKVKSGYVTDINLAKSAHETATIPKPMKGDKYYPTQKDGFKTLDALKFRNKPLIVQRKFDGWRFRILVDEGGCLFYTSSGDKHPGFKHIEKSLVSSYIKAGFTTPLMLDGEIYNHELGYYKVASACGTTKHITIEKSRLIDQMEFHLFDVCIDCIYEERLEIIKDFYSDVVIPVENIYIEGDEIKIDLLFRQFLSEGYEGLMLRTLDSKYEYKRSKALIKCKPFIDDEFQIIGFDKSITGPTLGALVCIAENGEKFTCDLKGKIGSDEYKQKIWNKKSDYLGKWVTIEFLEYTPDGIPRNGKAYRFRDQKDMS